MSELTQKQKDKNVLSEIVGQAISNMIASGNEKRDIIMIAFEEYEQKQANGLIESGGAALSQRIMPRFLEIKRDTSSGFSWLLKNERNACSQEDNSAMIRILAEKYNELAKHLNGA